MDKPDAQRRPTIEELLSRALLVKERVIPRDVVPPNDGVVCDDDGDDDFWF